MGNEVKKILFHINSLGLGGAEHVASLLCSRLAEEGMEVILATEWKEENEYPMPGGVERIDVGVEELATGAGRLKKAFLRYKRLRSVIKERKPDLVISFMKKANIRAALALADQNIPLMISVRNDPERDYTGGSNCVTNMLLKKKASGCVFQTTAVSSFFGEKFAQKSRVILNPLDDKYVQLNKTIVKTRNYRPVRNIIAVGRIVEQKNHMLLVRAFDYALKKFESGKEARADDSESGIMLNIYGKDGGIQNKIEEYLREHPHMKDRVSFKGTTDRLQDIYMEGDLFVLPSDYEGLPNALIEAMSMGMPCISTDCPCGGPGEIITDGENGRLVPVGDEIRLGEAILELLQDPQKAEAMGRKAALLAERVDPDAIYSQWKDYIIKVLEKR